MIVCSALLYIEVRDEASEENSAEEMDNAISTFTESTNTGIQDACAVCIESISVKVKSDI